MDEVKNKHEARGHLYPRPTAICNDCQASLVLCWGKVRDPYWRHKLLSNTCKGHLSGAESCFHKAAKSLICELLNRGGTLWIDRKCDRCSSGVERITVPSGLIWKQEIPHSNGDNKCVLDIAGIGEVGVVLMGIEICYTHRTETLEARANIPWIELPALDVLRRLDKEDVCEIVMDDLRMMTCDACIAKKDSKCARCTPGQICQRCKCILQVAEEDRLAQARRAHVAPKMTAIQTTAHPAAKIAQPLLQELHTLADALGYRSTDPYYLSEGQKILDCAIKGKYMPPRVSWYTVIDSEERDNPRWKAACARFLQRGQCLRCACVHKASYGKPFCYKCWLQTKREEDSNNEERAISYPYKEELRKQLAPLLNSVGGDWVPGIPCDICHDLADDETIYHGPRYTWWFGSKRRCCSLCLQDYVDANGIVLRPH